MKLLSLFSGVGSFEMAIKNLGIDVELVNYCEIDKYASKSYSSIHNVSESLNLWDITKINIDGLNTDIDMITHGSPCQDFSLAGIGKGGNEGSGTRSSLMWNTVEIVSHCKPKYVIWENVKNVMGSKNVHNFDKYLYKMNEMGYVNYSKVLNAKDYGIPQNRERIFVISILGEHDAFFFPQPFQLEKKLIDLLENEVDENFYLTSDKVLKLVNQIIDKQGEKGIGALIKNATKSGSIYCKNNGVLNCLYPTSETRRGRVIEDGNISGTIECSNELGKLEIKRVEKIGFYEYPNSKKPHQSNTVYSPHGISPTIDTMSGGNREPKIVEVCPIITPDREEKRQDGRRCKENEEPMFTITTQDRHGVLLVSECGNSYLVQIRKLIPLECWRLMGFKDEDFQKAKETGISNNQLYKQAGNSIVVNVLEEIFKILLKGWI